MPDKTVLVADIGGTNARFALASKQKNGITLTHERSFKASDFPTIKDVIRAFLEGLSEVPGHACLAAAGPLVQDSVKFTNTYWEVNRQTLAEEFQFYDLRIVNDFYALAMGVPHLRSVDSMPIKSGEPVANAPKLVIGPGTGLGQAILFSADHSNRVIATEGGHVSFSPCTDEEFEVFCFLMREHKRVSVERLLSGRGLESIYRAFCAIKKRKPAVLLANEITQAACSQSDLTALETLGFFFSVLGRVVGDAVLSTGARGGVVLGGGILPKVLQAFKKSDFTKSFTDKGRMSDYLRAVPVELIVSENAALIGAAVILENQ